MSPRPFHYSTSAAELVAEMRSDEHAPFAAMIEIADRCNETCVHCYQIQGQKGEIGTDDWRRVLDELAELGVVFLTISGGEATLRRDFLEIVSYARAKRFAIKLYTNGLNMSAAMAQQLADLAVQEVQISLYSHRAEVHDDVTRVPRSWQRTVDGARHLIAAGVKVVLKSPMMSMNAAEIDEYVQFVSGLGAEYSLDPTVDPREDGDRSTEAYRVDAEEFLAARTHPLLAHPVREARAPRSGSVCGACSGNVHVEANGVMHPCTQLQIPVGNALEEGIADAWRNNEVARSIRSTTWADLRGCGSCALSGYCSRCFATARVEANDALSPYKSACDRALLEYEAVHGVRPQVDRQDGQETGPFRGTAEHSFRAERWRDDKLAGSPEWARPPGRLTQLRVRGRAAADEGELIDPSAPTHHTAPEDLSLAGGPTPRIESEIE